MLNIKIVKEEVFCYLAMRELQYKISRTHAVNLLIYYANKQKTNNVSRHKS